MEPAIKAVEAVLVGGLAAALGVAAVTDLARRVVPNGCPAAVAALGLARALTRGLLGGLGPGPVIARALGGGAAVLAVMLAASWASARARGEPGVGGGDVKLLSAVGVWTGPVGGLAVVAGSCAAGVLGWALARAARLLSGHKDVIQGGKTTVGGFPLAPSIGITALVVVLLETLQGIEI